MRTGWAGALVVLAWPAASRAAVPPAPAVAVSTAPAFLEIRDDPRVELLGVVQLLSNAQVTSAGFHLHELPYVQAVEKHFAKYRRHPVVELYQQMAAGGFDYVLAYNFICGLGPPPQLSAVKQFPDPMAAKAGGLERLREFQLMLSDFARVSGFMEFFEQSRPLREPMLAQLRQEAADAHLQPLFEGYWGKPSRLRYGIIGSDFAEPVLAATTRERDPDGVERIWAIYGPEWHEGRLMYRLNTRIAHMCRELAWDQLIAEAEPFRDRIEKSRALFAPVDGSCADTWYDCVQRHVGFAMGTRIEERYSAEMARLWPIKYARIGMPYLKPLVDALQVYEKNRSRYPTLMEFYPQLLDALEKIPVARPPFLGHIVDALHRVGPPVIVYPEGQESLARSVKSRLAEIRGPKLPAAVSMTDAEALSRGVAGRPVVAVGTVADNQWVRQRWKELYLPFSAAPDAVRFRARPGDKEPLVLPGALSIVSTALNPDDQTQPVVLLTASQASGLAAAIAAEPADVDFIVLDGSQTVKSGIYEKTFLPWRLK